MTGFNEFCVSSYLTFRYVVKDEIAWKDGVKPLFPQVAEQGQIGVQNSSQVLKALRHLMDQYARDENVGVLLSGGIDSAILAALMPPCCRAYTIQFIAENALDETCNAKIYAESRGLEHHTVQVSWQDYLQCMDLLMSRKKSPLHAAEVGLFKAASAAVADGIHTLIVGNGADSTFGGLDKLLSRDWTFEEFVDRYSFVDPSRVVKKPVSMIPVYEEYRTDGGIDVERFLKVTHGSGIVQAFDNAIGAAGCRTVEPYEQLRLDTPLDRVRIRNGESKYLLRGIFEKFYPGLAIPQKIAFARPMDQWMRDWEGPRRPEFLKDFDIQGFTGEQKWLIYCLERFMNLMEAE